MSRFVRSDDGDVIAAEAALFDHCAVRRQVGVKLFAIACGTILYLMSQHRTVAALTLFYLAFAVAPWAHVLHSYTNI